MQVFLDLDGPILDVSNRYYAIYTDLLEEAGYTPLHISEYWAHKRNRLPETKILARTCPRPFVAAYTKKRLGLIEESRYLKMDTLQPGVAQLIAQWAKDHNLYLVTLRNNRDALLRELSYLGIRKYFLKVLSESDNDGSWRVKYRLVSPVADDAKRSIMVGDTEADVEAGRAVGLTTVAVTCGIRSRALLMEAKPDYVFEDMRGIHLEELILRPQSDTVTYL
ncbi:MAG: HAD family hydrolase [Thermodesulfobacteriota bacterium]|nr:HAD family hydrolase [Thermodesulfobacteriota bacterium]